MADYVLITISINSKAYIVTGALQGMASTKKETLHCDTIINEVSVD